MGSPPTPEPALHHCRQPGHCCGNNNFVMFVIVPTPNNNVAPNATFYNNAVTVATVSFAMSRNATSLSSIWTAARRTSLADSDPSSLPWPSLHSPPLVGILLVLVVFPLCCHCHSCCCVALQSNLIIILVPPLPAYIAFPNRDAV
jgi:hypothetical protein